MFRNLFKGNPFKVSSLSNSFITPSVGLRLSKKGFLSLFIAFAMVAVIVPVQLVFASANTHSISLATPTATYNPTPTNTHTVSISGTFGAGHSGSQSHSDNLIDDSCFYVTVNWGDGSSVAALTSPWDPTGGENNGFSGKPYSGSHPYSSTGGPYTITTQLRRNAGFCAAADYSGGTQDTIVATATSTVLTPAYTISATPTVDGLQVSLSGTATGSDYPGTQCPSSGSGCSDFGVEINWGDGNTTESTDESFMDTVSIPANKYFTGPWSASYTYEESGTYTIFAYLYNDGVLTSQELEVTVEDLLTTLTVTKVVVGGPCEAEDFALFANETPLSSGVPEELEPNTYTVTEVNNCVAEEGGEEDEGGDDVVFNSGFFASVSNWIIPQAMAQECEGEECEPQDPPVLDPCEENPELEECQEEGGEEEVPAPVLTPDYVSVFTGACEQDGSVTLNQGDELECTLYNIYVPYCEENPEDKNCSLLGDVAGRLTVIKEVVNDNGGESVAEDFTLQVTGDNGGFQSFSGSTEGRTFWLLPGSYNVSEPSLSFWYYNYFEDDDLLDCGTDGNFEIGAGDEKSCTLVNDDKPTADLRIIKVVNGSASPTGFLITVANTEIPEDTRTVKGSGEGTVVTLLAGNTYTVTEPENTHYQVTYSESCEGGVINMPREEGESDELVEAEAEEELVCIVTNTYVDLPEELGGGQGGSGLPPGTGGGGRLVPQGSVLGDTEEGDDEESDEEEEDEGSQERDDNGSDEEGDDSGIAGENGSGQEGEVLGDTDEECAVDYIKTYIHPFRANDAEDVKRLQAFLNKYLGLSLTVSGDYDAASIQAVKDFQLKEFEYILKPWGISQPTGFVYITTKRRINQLQCPSMEVAPLPELTTIQENG